MYDSTLDFSATGGVKRLLEKFSRQSEDWEAVKLRVSMIFQSFFLNCYFGIPAPNDPVELPRTPMEILAGGRMADLPMKAWRLVMEGLRYC